jgi:general stress protein 26
MLSKGMQKLIMAHTAGAVATIDADGLPAVSPKGTFVVSDEKTIAFGNIRSPGTLANLRRQPDAEVCFVDPVLRRSVRVKGTATILRKSEASDEMLGAFASAWGPLLPHITAFIRIDVTHAEMIVSPAYDIGFTSEELRLSNLEKLNALS